MHPASGSHDGIQDARIGFWSALTYAILLVALDVSFAVMAVQAPPSGWQGIDDYVAVHQDIAFLPQAIGLASIPSLLLMLTSIHTHADRNRKTWTLAGLSFGTAYAALIGSLYFIQVGIVLPSLKHGNWQGLDQFVFANPRSVAWGLDHFAWSLLGIAFLLAAWAFEGDRLRRWIRWLLVANGIANASLIFAFAFELEALALSVAFVSWVVALPVTVVLIALMFRRDIASSEQ